jgi:hypothetical protein
VLAVILIYSFRNYSGHSLLDSSLPQAVRKSFLLVVGFVACGDKAHHQQMDE